MCVEGAGVARCNGGAHMDICKAKYILEFKKEHFAWGLRGGNFLYEDKVFPKRQWKEVYNIMIDDKLKKS